MAKMTSLMVDEHVLAEWKAEAAKRGISMAALIRLAVQKEVKGQPETYIAPPETYIAPPASPAKLYKTSQPKECRHGLLDCRVCRTGRWA
jgi:hypothetical protein